MRVEQKLATGLGEGQIGIAIGLAFATRAYTPIEIECSLETFNLSDFFAGLRGADRRNYLADPIACVGPHLGSWPQKLHRYQPMKLD